MNTITNSVRLIGRLGADPEVRQLGLDKKVAHFTMATHEHYTDAGGNKVEKTCWHNLTAWNLQAQVVETYLRKGQEVAIEGKINNYSYTDKEGTTKYRQEIIVNEIRLLGRPSDAPVAEEVPF